MPPGWQVTNTDLRYPGYAYQPGWVFGNPAGWANATGGTASFAIVASDHDGAHHYQDTHLIAPAANMTPTGTRWCSSPPT